MGKKEFTRLEIYCNNSTTMTSCRPSRSSCPSHFSFSILQTKLETNQSFFFVEEKYFFARKKKTPFITREVSFLKLKFRFALSSLLFLSIYTLDFDEKNIHQFTYFNLVKLTENEFFFLFKIQFIHENNFTARKNHHG